jgi:hypothetical protein
VKLGHSEEHRLRAFQNRAWKKILGPKSEEVTGEWKKWYTLHQLQLSDHGRGYDGQGMWHIWGEDKCIQGFGRNT